MAQHDRLAQYGRSGEGAFSTVRHRAGDVYQQTEDLVRRNPASSAGVMFGLGFGVGLLLALMAATPPRRRPHWYERYTPDWLASGRIKEGLTRYVPESVSRYVKS
jgi:hypothetical protein